MQGLTCIEVKAAYSTSAFATTPDYTTLGVPALAASTVFSKQVCVFKMTRQASAVLKFDMCTTDTCELPCHSCLAAQGTHLVPALPLRLASRTKGGV
jgi:hypothetical protein